MQSRWVKVAKECLSNLGRMQMFIGDVNSQWGYPDPRHISSRHHRQQFKMMEMLLLFFIFLKLQKIYKNLFFSTDFSSASTIVALAQRADRGTEISCRSLSSKQDNHNDHDDDNDHSTSYDDHDDHDSHSSASHPALSAPLVAHATLDVLCKMPTQHCFVMLMMIMLMITRLQYRPWQL